MFFTFVVIVSALVGVFSMLCTCVSYVIDYDIESRRNKDALSEKDVAQGNTYYEGTCILFNVDSRTSRSKYIFAADDDELFYNQSLLHTRHGYFSDIPSGGGDTGTMLVNTAPTAHEDFARFKCHAAKDASNHTLLLVSPNKYPIHLSNVLTDEMLRLHADLKEGINKAAMISGFVELAVLIVVPFVFCFNRILSNNKQKRG